MIRFQQNRFGSKMLRKQLESMGKNKNSLGNQVQFYSKVDKLN